MKHTVERDTRDARYDSMFIGEVVENVDPDGRGRVQVVVGGIYDEGSPWIEPLGQMRGVLNGIYWVPEVGSNVAIWFHQGDVDFPYYMPAQFGAPKGVPDTPEQGRNVNRYALRWRDFYIQIDGTPGDEKLTIKDLPTQTFFEIERTNGGDMTTDVEHDRIERVLNDKTTTVEEGDETHTVLLGKRTTTIQQNDDKTVVAGDQLSTTLLGNSTETVAVGNKTLTAGLNVSITGGAAVNILAGGALSMVGTASATMQSLGPSSMISAGLQTKSMLGGIADTIAGGILRNIVGAFVMSVTGVTTWTFNGLCLMLGTLISIGNGPYKKLVNEDVFTLWGNLHTHPAPGAPPTQKVVLGATGPDVELALVTTTDLTAS